MQSDLHTILFPGFSYNAVPGFEPLLPEEEELVHIVDRPGNMLLPWWLAWFVGWLPIWYTNQCSLRKVRELLIEYPDSNFQIHAHSIGNIAMWYVWYHLNDEERKRVVPMSHETVTPQWLGMTFYSSFWKNAWTAVPQFVVSLLFPWKGMRLGWKTVGAAFLNSDRRYFIEGHIEKYQVADSGLAFLGLLVWYSGMRYFREMVQKCPSYRIVLAPDDPLIPRDKIEKAIKRAGGDPNKIILHLPKGTPHCLVGRDGSIREDAVKVLRQLL